MAVSRQIDFLVAGLIDSSGLPLSGGRVETYDAGTTNPRLTYTDQLKTTPATNPIILNSLGQALVFGDGAYKFIIKRADGTTVTTIDNLIINEQISIPAPVISRQFNPSAVINSVLQTSLYSYTIPSNTITTGKMLRATLYGVFSNSTGSAQSFTFTLKLGSQNIFAYTHSGVASTANIQSFRIETDILQYGANTQVASGKLFLSSSATDSSNSLVISPTVAFGSQSALTANTTTANNIEFLGTLSAASTNLVMTLRSAFIELL